MFVTIDISLHYFDTRKHLLLKQSGRSIQLLNLQLFVDMHR